MENVYNALDKVIDYIKESNDYKECLNLKSKIKDNKEIMNLINDLKDLQKKYIRSNYDSNIKKDLDKCSELLLEIPIYHMYMDSLDKVNNMIDYVRDRLNDYFYKILNP